MGVEPTVGWSEFYVEQAVELYVRERQWEALRRKGKKQGKKKQRGKKKQQPQPVPLADLIWLPEGGWVFFWLGLEPAAAAPARAAGAALHRLSPGA